MARLPKHRVELIGKGVTGACIALVALLSIRIYSASVLHYGQRLKLKDILKLSK